MNRLIIVGNGFDLAHGMKTSYNDFIKGYLLKVITEAQNKGSYDDCLIKITRVADFNIDQIRSPLDYINHFYRVGFLKMKNEMIRLNLNSSYPVDYTNPFKITFKASFFQALLKECSDVNWVDIEAFFFRYLKKIYKEVREQKAQLEELNMCFAGLINELKIYLKNLPKPGLNNQFADLLDSKFNQEEFIDFNFYDNLIEINGSFSPAIEPRSIHILNFNYTPTIEYYINNIHFTEIEKPKIYLNYIHGNIINEKNPLVFGFGDELDEEYKALQNSNIKGFLKFIKSFWYSRNSNYHDLLRFIESDDFQVLIAGHSCGLSDRTMLNMIFEHRNCRSIKLYYYQKSSEENNFTDLTEELSRHFTRNGEMRRKLVPLDKSSKLPQVKSN